jgi:hypothetical protein
MGCGPPASRARVCVAKFTRPVWCWACHTGARRSAGDRGRRPRPKNRSFVHRHADALCREADWHVPWLERVTTGCDWRRRGANARSLPASCPPNGRRTLSARGGAIMSTARRMTRAPKIPPGEVESATPVCGCHLHGLEQLPLWDVLSYCALNRPFHSSSE